MGTNRAPILANLYLVMLEQELKTICKAKNIKCPTFLKRFIDDGFGIFIGTKKEFEFITWVNEFLKCTWKRNNNGQMEFWK